MAEIEVRMENIVLGLLAHVDRGKTSLSEALLYESGRISEKGRVDHGDSVLDKDSLERKKGITIYAKSVYFTKENKRFFLLDTPGHQEFSSEMERCLAVIDYGILLIEGNDGIQKRELHLFERAREKGIPLFLVVNKMDLFQGDREALLREIQEAFSCEGIIDFSPYAFSDLAAFLQEEDFSQGVDSKENVALEKKEAIGQKAVPSEGCQDFLENLALLSEEGTAEYLENGRVPLGFLRENLQKRKLFPLFFTSALKQEGITQLLSWIFALCQMPTYSEELRGILYKISKSPEGRRIGRAKLLGGSLSLRQEWRPSEKALELHLEGVEEEAVESVEPGMLFTMPISENAGLGYFPEDDHREKEKEGYFPTLLSIEGEEILQYRKDLEELQKEFPEWGISISLAEKEVTAQLSGNLQKELLTDLFAKRLGKKLHFSKPKLRYGESPRREAYGRGAVLEPGHRISLLLRLIPMEGEIHREQQKAGEEEKQENSKKRSIFSIEKMGELPEGWVSRLETEWAEEHFPGPLLSGPYENYALEISNLSFSRGSAYYVDFQEAVYQAFRMAQATAGVRLLMPYFSYEISASQEKLGKILQEIERQKGKQEELLSEGESYQLLGKIPGTSLSELQSFVQGEGESFSFSFSSYQEMEEEQALAVLEERFGIPSEELPLTTAGKLYYGEEFVSEAALGQDGWEENTSGGKSGASSLKLNGSASLQLKNKGEQSEKKKKGEEGISLEEELNAIFERTFGPLKNRGQEAIRTEQKLFLSKEKEARLEEARAQYAKKGKKNKRKKFLVDGYNFLFAKEEWKALAQTDLMAGREQILPLLSEYAAYHDVDLYLIFDAYRVKSNPGKTLQLDPRMQVIFTKEGESADFALSKMANDFSQSGYPVVVVSSDQAVQIQGFSGKGAIVYSSKEFAFQVEEMKKRISDSL
ncbi:NYN domain-containing protein [Oribacterium sinus]|uniref:NYN domain-containing protein n=1 Tax=Oribacterium sinus TaxID=237576 RepID=UPI0028ED7524|nr:NYN domain-containing protein [Oribacterium sinus]